MKKNGLYQPRRYSSLAERRATVQQFRESGLTQKDFAAERQMTLSTLTRWMRDSRLGGDPETTPETVQFHSLALPPLSDWAAEVQQTTGTVVRFRASTPPDLARAILRASQ